MAAALLLRGGCSLATKPGQAGPRKTAALTTWLASPPPQPHPGFSLVAKEAFFLATTPSQAQDPRPPAHRRTPLQAQGISPLSGLVARGVSTLATGPKSGLKSSHWLLGEVTALLQAYQGLLASRVHLKHVGIRKAVPHPPLLRAAFC